MGSRQMARLCAGLVTAFALALLIDRVFLINDPRNGYYAAFTPEFDCHYNASRCGLRQIYRPACHPVDRTCPDRAVTQL